jgi:hypothetical protein
MKTIIAMAVTVGALAASPIRAAESLRWATVDNGGDIAWDEARTYCRTMGAGWRLPARDELLALYRAQTGSGVPCGRWQCRAPANLHLTGPWFWSTTTVAADQARDADELAWGVLLSNGVATQALRGVGFGGRALCVRDR